MTKTVKIGSLKIGGKNPVAIKGMLKSPTTNTQALIKEGRRLQKEGAEAIRIAVKNTGDVRLSKLLKKHISIPLVADIHFHYKLALSAIEEGFDCIRLNPLNISKKNQIEEIATLAKKNKISMRVGVNSGGFKNNFSSPEALAREMVKRVDVYLKILESKGFFDIMVSLKGSDVLSTIIANRIFAKRYRYPLHLGVTATGYSLEGVVKSSIGIGSLLSEGIGSVMRVSLTAPSFWEIRVAKYILQSLNLRRFGIEVISCPTCSRCEVGLINIVDKLHKALSKENIDKNLKIAVMGCVVNGPGEASQADIGVAFGKKKAAIFKKGKILGWSREETIIADLIAEVKNLWT